jgi:hypothetical protein
VKKITFVGMVMQLEPTSYELLSEDYEGDEDSRGVYTQLKERSIIAMEGNGYHLQDELYKLDKLFIPLSRRIKWVREGHTSKITRHFGKTKTVENLQRYMYWTKMQEQVTRFVTGYVLYKTNEPSSRNLGLYMPLPVSSRSWKSISMDFVGGLHMYQRGHDYLFFMVDFFNKMCVFIVQEDDL